MKSEAATIWIRQIRAWAILMVLLATTFTIAHVPLGKGNLIAGLAIAGIKAAVVLWLFMQLFRSRAIMVMAFTAGLFWLALLFALTFADVLTR